jgi:hypothetical protein
MSDSYADETIIGEVVESGTGTFTAQCLEVPESPTLTLLDPPEFGAIVKIPDCSSRIVPTDSSEDGEIDPFAAGRYSGQAVESGLIFGLVAHAQMTSLDAGRRPTALGYATEEQLRLHQPQIFELIVTEFSGLLIAQSDADGKLRYGIPPKPPRIHTRVYACSNAEIIAATTRLSYLRRILDGAPAGVSSEEMCAAVIRHGWNARRQSSEYLHDAGQQLAAAIGMDYDRLERIVKAVIP